MWTFRPIPSVFLIRPVSVIGLVMLLCGCKKDLLGLPSIETEQQSIEFRWDGTVIGAEKSNFYSSSEVTEATLKIYLYHTPTSSFTYSCAASWVHISESHSLQELTIEADFNTQKASREATISLVTEPNVRGEQGEQTVRIVQQGLDPSTLISPSSLSLAADDTKDHTVTINYSGSIHLSSDDESADWLDYPTYESGSQTVTVTIRATQPNPSTIPRQRTLTAVLSRFKATEEYTTTIQVTQQGIPDTDIAPQIDNPVLRTALAEQCGAQGEKILRSRLETLTSLDLSAAAGESIGSIDPVLAYCPNLQELICKELDLTRLDLSPLKGLKSLDCSGNRLTSLSGLPSGLTTLNCSGNRLTSLSGLPSGLTTLNCSGNRLTSLSSFPSGLTALNCSNNQLTSLSVSSLSYLTTLDCSHNNLQTSYLYIGYAPVETLDCSYNQLTSLLISSTRLQTLNCSYNRFSSHLSLTSFRSLKKLDCSGNNNLRTVSINSTALPTLEYTKDPATQIY